MISDRGIARVIGTLVFSIVIVIVFATLPFTATGTWANSALDKSLYRLGPPMTAMSILSSSLTLLSSSPGSTRRLGSANALSQSRRQNIITLTQVLTVPQGYEMLQEEGSVVAAATAATATHDGQARDLVRNKAPSSASPGTVTFTPSTTPTKPKRHKSRQPTMSPTLSPIQTNDEDDQTGSDDEYGYESEGDDAIDTVAPESSSPTTSQTASPSKGTEKPLSAPPSQTPILPTPRPQMKNPSTPPFSVPIPYPAHLMPVARKTTSQPTLAYVPEDEDPITKETASLEKQKAEDEEQELEHVQTEAKTAGGIGFLLALFAMIFTAHQMSENPDGIYASICRLAITLVGCVVKLILMPCRNFLGNRYHAGHIPVSTMEYREPYRGGSNVLEMT